MLKAVLKKSREGGKGSKKEPGMCPGKNWGEQAWWVWQQDPTPAQAGPISLTWAWVREVICVRTDSILEL